jgi:spermidine synthase
MTVRTIPAPSGRPGPACSLTLRERQGIVEVLAGHVVLLSSAALETERAFGSLLSRLLDRAPARVIVGGLGFGATLRGVLDVAPAGARVVVAEKVAGVADLVAGDLGRFAQHPLQDARVEVLLADVADVIAGCGGDVDAILLDVDNGPHWASFRSNARLYTPACLASAKRALRPGGALAVWSGYRADGFRARLRAAGFLPSVVPLREGGHVRARAYVGVAPSSGIHPAR